MTLYTYSEWQMKKYEDYKFYRSLGFRAITAFRMSKYGFINTVIDYLDI